MLCAGCLTIMQLKIYINMSDKEILEELRDQRQWWETRLEKVEAEAKDYKTQIAKTTRLIVLLEEKVYKK